MQTKSVFFFVASLLLFAACKNDPDTTNKPDTLQYLEPFKATSVFYNKIDSNATVDQNSATMVGSLVDQANQAFIVVAKEWTVPVFFADANTPRHDVEMTASWAPKKTLKNVPIPDWAEADPSDDGHMTIVDEVNGCVYDFWQMKAKNSGWKASWGNVLELSSDGVFPEGYSARGSGFELLQGLIWPQELENGAINHALIFSYDHTKSGGPVPPATESDGTTDAAWGIPEGALVQLNPNLDLDSLGLNSYEKTIARCLQEYGMYCADDGGGLSLYAIHPLSVKTNPYESIWGDQTYIDVSKIPVGEFRVLEMGAQDPSNDNAIVNNSCAEWE